MQLITIDDIPVSYEGDMLEEELAEYVKRGREKYGHNLHGMTCEADGEYVDITYNVPATPFSRLRRITGYLVGDMSRWNNAKRKEEGDRVKHGTDEK